MIEKPVDMDQWSLADFLREIEAAERCQRATTEAFKQIPIRVPEQIRELGESVIENVLPDSEDSTQLVAAPVGWSLKITKDPDEKPILLLGDLTVGRSQTADLTLDDVKVSRSHAKIVLVDDRVQLIDLNSSNGTFVNRDRIHMPVWLDAGDMIRLGDTILVLVRS